MLCSSNASSIVTASCFATTVWRGWWIDDGWWSSCLFSRKLNYSASAGVFLLECCSWLEGVCGRAHCEKSFSIWNNSHSLNNILNSNIVWSYLIYNMVQDHNQTSMTRLTITMSSVCARGVARLGMMDVLLSSAIGPAEQAIRSEISRAYIWHISGISQAYYRNISGTYQAYLRHI